MWLLSFTTVQIRMIPEKYQFTRAEYKLKTEDCSDEVFLHSLNGTWPETKIIAIIIRFYEDKTINQTSYSYR